MTDLPPTPRVLVVCSGNPRSGNETFRFDIDQAFVRDQVDALRNAGAVISVHLIERPGAAGYLAAAQAIRRRLSAGHFDLVHAHVGASGLAAVLQRRWPTVVTFHGSDVNRPPLNLLSSVVSLLAAWRIFISEDLHQRLFVSPKRRYSVLPCGVDLGVFERQDRRSVRRKHGLSEHTFYVLFSSTFANPVKNAALARAACESLDGVTLLELKNRSRQEVAELMSACDALLLTSDLEGSPQVVKEALACDCPVVSVDVGDVRSVLLGLEGCAIVPRDPSAIAEALRAAFRVRTTFKGRQAVQRLDNALVATELMNIYSRVMASSARSDGIKA